MSGSRYQARELLKIRKPEELGVKIVGIALMVIGLGLGYWGYEISGSLGSQLSETMMGSPTDEVMWRYIGGATSFVVGLYLFLKK